MTQLTENLDVAPGDSSQLIENLQQSYNNLDKLVNKGVSALANAAGQTLTAAQLLSGLILRSGATAVSDTTPTAALLVAAIPHAAVGNTFEFSIQNSNSGTLTLLAGSRCTLSGTTTVATVNTRRYAAKLTNVTSGAEAYTLYGVATSAL